MKRAHLFAAAALLLLGAHFAVSQRNFSDVEVKFQKVRGNVYMLTGAGGNIGLSVGADGTLMIDDQFAPLAERIKEAIRQAGGQEPELVINTHWHGDHTGGNKVFGKTAHIIAHSNVRKRLKEGVDRPGRKTPPAPRQALPVVTFEKGLSIHFNGEEIKVAHFPKGHTDGDSVIFFTESNVVHMGDLFRTGGFPYIDLNSGGDVAGFIKNVKALLDELPDDVKIIPGHGEISAKDDVQAYYDMIVETTSLIRDRMEDGMSLEEIQEEGLPAKWDSLGKGFVSTGRWIEIVYNGYSS